MTYHLDIPESVADSIRLPVPEVEPRLRTELALALYAQGILSFGKAAELADVTRYVFAQLTGGRDIPRHYTAAELTQDLNYAGGQ
jgi:predicted HTH domain antitoxin